MITELLVERAVDNLEATYLAVGSQGEGAWSDRWPGGVACLSKLPHPVSNFAVIRYLDPTAAKRVGEFSRERQAFNVYVAPGEAQEDSIRLLHEHGFRTAGRLLLMLSYPAESEEPASLYQALTFQDRLELCRFMARQFFSRQTSSLREGIALATARSGLNLYGDRRGHLQAAAMVSNSTGMLGVYNLCVDSRARERGHGSELLSALGWMAHRRGDLLTLQCDPSLEPWYCRRRYECIGTISVLCLDPKACHAIM